MNRQQLSIQSDSSYYSNFSSNHWTLYWSQVKIKEQKIVDLADINDFTELQKILEMKNNSLPFNINSSNGLNGWSAIHFAVFNDNIQMVKLIMDNGGDLDLLTAFKSSVLHLVVQTKSILMTRYLIDQGINLNSQDSDLNTPLHLATESNQLEIAKLLLERGAIPTLKNSFNQEPSNMAGDNLFLNLFELFGINISSAGERQQINGLVMMNSGFDKKLRLLCSVQEQQQITRQCINSEINVKDLKFVSKLGQGSFGDVYLIYDTSKKQYFALKCLNLGDLKRDNSIKYAFIERKILKKMKSLYVTQLKASFQNETHLFLLETYVSGQNLHKFIKTNFQLNEDEAAPIMAQVLLGLNALHEAGFLFRDLKPQNVMIQSSGAVKLIDFGLSKQINQKVEKEDSISFCGSLAYLAPEMLKRQGHDKSLDYYLLGLVLYELLHGQPPYFDLTRSRIYKNILDQELILRDDLSSHTKALLEDLLDRDPKMRPSFLQVKMNKFFYNVNFASLAKLHSTKSTDSPKNYLNQVHDLNTKGDIIMEKWDWNVTY